MAEKSLTPAPMSTLSPSHPCVVLVPSGTKIDPGFEGALSELNRRGYPVRRVRQDEPPPAFRDRMVEDALISGFRELLWLDPSVVFDPTDVERLRAHGLPFVCGVYPLSGVRGLACEFAAGTTAIRFGRRGGLLPVVACGLGFALVRSPVFEAISRRCSVGVGEYFAGAEAGPGTVVGVVEDALFCDRVRASGFDIVADTSIRLWRAGGSRLGWEDAGGDRERHADYTLSLPRAGSVPAPPKTERVSGEHPDPPRSALRSPAGSLPDRFPQIRLYVVTYPANGESLRATLESIRRSDWGEEPTVVTQPQDWPTGRQSGARNYRRALEAAQADGCDFALILEDDVRVNEHLRYNLRTNPLVRRDQCDYLSLFIPDLIADPWERSEPHLGYRLAKPRYAGPNVLWERERLWGSQGYLLSRRIVRAALERWDRLIEGQDTRLLGLCSEFQLPLWYTVPCLVEHAPAVSAFGTPAAYAPDFDPAFRLGLGAGFQPPENVPGWLTLPEAELLWRTAADRDVLELGVAAGRASVCLAQRARRLVSVDRADQSEAAEWVRRYGLQDRVEFRRGDVGAVCRHLTGPFGLIFIDTLHDAESVRRDIASALPLLGVGGLLAFHDYPNPGWPDVRRVVDEHARRFGWERLAQAGFLGVFRVRPA
jgi:hypothetical protein